MRITIATLSIAALCTATAVGIGLAQPPKAGQNGQPGQQGQAGQQNAANQNQKGPQFNAERFLKDHDTNNDGKLSKEELPKRMQDGFAECDKDGDSSLSAQELKAHAQEMANRSPQMIEFVYWIIDVPPQDQVNIQELQSAYETMRKIDANNDGTIDQKEVMTFREQRRKERVDRAFEDLDKNSDKKITKDEARGIWADSFAQLDKDGNGSLDEKEIDEAYNLSQNGQGNNK